MKITYAKAERKDAEVILRFCKELIDAYEDVETIEYDRVLAWVRRKIEHAIDEYVSVYADGEAAGYYRFYKNEDGEYELDDLYIFPEFQGRGIGSEIVRACCASVDAPVMLYAFVKNVRAVSLYRRLGFETVEQIGTSRCIMKRTPK